MSEFGVGATLEVSVPDSQLRAARQKIEEELGDVTVDVDASTSGRSGGGGGRMAGQERAMSRSLLSEANRLKESNIDLDEYRNELLEEILDTLEDNGYDDKRRPPGGGGTLLLGGAGAAAAATAALSTAPDWVPIEVPRPDWLSALDLPDPTPPPVPPAKPGDNPPREPPKKRPPSEEPVPEPDPAPNPSPNPGPEPVPDGPTGPPEPITPPSPGDDTPDSPPVPGGVLPRDVPEQLLERTSPKEVRMAAGAGALTIGGAKVASRATGGVSAVGSSIGFPAPGAMVAQTANRAQKKDREERGFIEEKLLSVLREAGIGQQTASLTADITNDVTVDGVSERKLQSELDRAKQDVLRQVREQFNG